MQMRKYPSRSLMIHRKRSIRVNATEIAPIAHRITDTVTGGGTTVIVTARAVCSAGINATAVGISR